MVQKNDTQDPDFRKGQPDLLNTVFNIFVPAVCNQIAPDIAER